MVFVPMALDPPKAGAKELSYNSLNLIHEFTSLFFAEGDCCRFAWGKFSSCLCGHQCFSVVAHQDSPKASPRAIFK